MNESLFSADKPNLAFVGNYLPRNCGIATFTTDLCEAVAKESSPEYNCFAVPVNDTPEGYRYPPRVRFEIQQHNRSHYVTASDFLNLNQVEAVFVQHEFGIYGGSNGGYLLDLLKSLRMPVITTLHTILKDPSPGQKAVLRELGRMSDRLAAMSRTGMEFLRDVYGVPEEKLVFIPHGIPDMPFIDSNYYKDQYGVEGRKVILTFGLLSPGKGIEYAIEALPRVIRKHSDAVYIVLGATHPHLKKRSGEQYRQSLYERVKQLGLQEHVLFHNRFVELGELCEFLGAADLYVTPYLNEAQIVSGTLTYALGAGKATVSTPYWYAKELLAEGRGRLVPFRGADALAEEIGGLLANEVERHAMRKRAYHHTRPYVWKTVARQYLDVLRRVKEERKHAPRPVFQIAALSEQGEQLPEIDLRHLHTLTDGTGILEHAVMNVPDRRHGYTADDNARALIVSVQHWRLQNDPAIWKCMHNYLSFLLHAFNPDTGRFRNRMDYNRLWLDDAGSEDCHGRALWALGKTIEHAPNQSVLALAVKLFDMAVPAVERFSSPRAWAFSLLGLTHCLEKYSGNSEARRYAETLCRKLLRRYEETLGDDWRFCENCLTYDNARIPHGLMAAGRALNDPEAAEMGLVSLEWLMERQTNPDGTLFLVGNKGWYPRGGTPARFDQQPLDANALLEACLEAYKVSRDPRWIAEAKRAFNWFMGGNDGGVPLYDFTTGGCRDSLTPDGVNLNQGAESTLAWLMSLLSMKEHELEQPAENEKIACARSACG